MHTNGFGEMGDVISFDPFSERLIKEGRVVRRAYYLARRCGWRLKVCRSGIWRGQYQLVSTDGRPLAMPRRAEGIVTLCERVLNLL
jgi:hypothetical protein